jgi:hypothetical protein
MNDDAKAAGDWAAVVAGYRRELAALGGQPGPKHDEVRRTLTGVQAALGQSLLRRGRHAEAEPVLRECLTVREMVQPDSWLRFNTMSLLGGALLGQGKHAEAEPLLLRGYEGMKEREAAIPAVRAQRLPEAVERIVRLYEATGRPGEAAAWRARLPRPVAPPPRPVTPAAGR